MPEIEVSSVWAEILLGPWFPLLGISSELIHIGHVDRKVCVHYPIIGQLVLEPLPMVTVLAIEPRPNSSNQDFPESAVLLLFPGVEFQPGLLPACFGTVESRSSWFPPGSSGRYRSMPIATALSGSQTGCPLPAAPPAAKYPWAYGS